MSDDKKLFADVKSPRSTPSVRTRLPPTSDIKELHARLRADPRFNPPTPSIWTRLALVALVFTLLWLAVSMRAEMARTPESARQQWSPEEYQHKPAVTALTTEYLPDGRARVKAAQPTLRIYT